MSLCALLVLSLFLIPVISDPVGAASTNSIGETQACLSCHAQRGLTVTFRNKETLEAYVDAEALKTSVHQSLSCSQCHPDFLAATHPQRTFQSKAQFQTKLALVCRRCHADSQIRESSIHTTLLSNEKKGAATVCTNCHGSHVVKPITKTKRYLSEEKYCLKCHGYRVSLTFRNEEALSGTINMSTLQGSVHNKLTCSDCHYGFSSDEHPKRQFASRRDYTLASSDNCRRCHFDKYTKTMDSIHYTIRSQGHLAAPVCIDCHDSHGTSSIGKDRVQIARRCQKCHAEIYATYSKSVHGNALLNEKNKDVPVCTDCHTAHTIEDPRTLNYQERIPDMCSNCHANEMIVGKYGLSTNVVDNYLSDFHGVTLKFYRMQKDVLNKPAKPIAVCTDCHGTHNINSTIGPEATIVKANLVKRCRSCHADASTNFPSAWLSHYEPSLTRTPLVFFVKLAYKIFIPILVVGLILQILLHIWRYVIDR